ncbi:hypothetical protein Barb6_00788 [Bacteroidales bacterium Barb6]|nr:hypothetical protein Barb6_00788 [Bacteroidales bacterium Barb6]
MVKRLFSEASAGTSKHPFLQPCTYSLSPKSLGDNPKPLGDNPKRLGSSCDPFVAKADAFAGKPCPLVSHPDSQIKNTHHAGKVNALKIEPSTLEFI